MVRITEHLNMNGNDIDNLDNVSGDSSAITFEDDIDMNGNDIDGIDNVSASGSSIRFEDDIDMNNNTKSVFDTYAFDGDYFDVHESIMPNTDNHVSCGFNIERWQSVYCVTLYEGDHVFSEKVCELCGGDFKEGEALVSYVLSNTEEGTRCIPVHLNCAIKPENQTKNKRDDVINSLKSKDKYIDPVEAHNKSTQKAQEHIDRKQIRLAAKEAREKMKAEKNLEEVS